MLRILIGAGVLGTVIEGDGEFSGWMPMILCVLATLLPTALVNSYTTPAFFFVGPLVGAVVGGFAISALCGMSVRRASIVAGIYLCVQIVIDIGLPGDPALNQSSGLARQSVGIFPQLASGRFDALDFSDWIGSSTSLNIGGFPEAGSPNKGRSQTP